MLRIAAVAFASALFLPAAEGATINVQVGSFFFSLGDVSIQTGDTVRWTFVDGGHTVTSGPCTPGCQSDGLFDSGFRSSGAVFQHTFGAAGTFPYFCVPHASFMQGVVRVSAPPPPPALTCNLTATPPAGTAPLQVRLTANASGGTPPYDFLWDFGDGGEDIVQDPINTYLTQGTYQVTLTVTDSLSATKQCTTQVLVSDLACAATADPNAGDAPLPVTLTGSASLGAPPYTFSWDFMDGTPADAVQVASHTFANPGTYDVMLEVQDSDGVPCSASVSVRADSPGCGPADVDGDGVCDGVDVCPTAYNPGQEDGDADGAGDLCDVCPSTYNPAQDDLDGDGEGDACDLTVTDPLEGGVLGDCSSPPTIEWTPGGFNRFRVFIAWAPTFAEAKEITSGDTLLKTTSWTVPRKKWRRACTKANPTLHIRVFGRSTTTRRTSLSETVTIETP